MLAIQRMPYYKNKLFMSSMAVLAGFVMTVGLIRAVNPADTSVHQSAVPSADKRASSLIPIKASSSETSTESGGAKSTDATSGSTSTSLSMSSRTAASGSAKTQTSPSGTSTQQTSTSTTQPTKPSTSSDGTTTPAPAPTCAVTLLTIGLLCH